jgi:hypothetical protein
MVVKDNQPTLKADLETLFARSPGPGQPGRLQKGMDDWKNEPF